MQNKGSIASKEKLIESSTNQMDFDNAISACLEYIENYNDDPHCLDFKLTHSVLLTFLNHSILYTGKLPDIVHHSYEGNEARKELCSSDLPSLLINGLVLDPRIKSGVKRETAVNFFNVSRNLYANELYKIFHEAEKEAKSLLIDGEIRGNVENKSNKDLYDDAEIYFKAYMEGDLDGSYKGFNYLKSLNPTDSYFRNALGAILTDRGDYMKAIQEFLYGVYLNPRGAKVTCNLMNLLSRMEMHFLILDIWLNYDSYTSLEDDINAKNDINSIVLVSKTCLMGLVSLMSKGNLTKNDIVSSEKSVFSDLEPIVRPWYPQN